MVTKEGETKSKPKQQLIVPSSMSPLKFQLPPTTLPVSITATALNNLLKTTTKRMRIINEITTKLFLKNKNRHLR